MAPTEMTQLPESVQEGRYADNLNRSCEPCRGRKIRCIQGKNPTSGKCARCERQKLACVYIAPQAKKKRKRTDARVAELEKELRQLKHRIDGAEGDSQSGSPHSGMDEDVQSFSAEEQVAQLHLPMPPSLSTMAWAEIDMDELDDSSEQQLLDNFIHNLLPHLPFIVFSNMPTVQDMRRNQPALFAAILAASAASVSPSLAQSLAHRLDGLYAEKVVVNGEKSLDLVQALIITAIFYHPPFRFAALKFTQYAHMAANMALDLRMGREHRRNHPSYPDKPETMHGWRAFIACYILCSSMALALRRPSMLKFSDWMEYCIDRLQTSELTSDRTLAAWAILQHIAEESATVLGFDRTRSPLDLRETTTQASLKAFEKQLIAWKLTNWDKTNGSLKIHFHYVRSAIHEICLHHDYDPDEFRPPYLMRPRPLHFSVASLLSPVYTSSLLAIAESAHAILDIFLEMDTDTHRFIPVIVYTRMFYAIVVLSKLAVSARSQDSSIGTMIDFESLKLIDYLYRTMAALKRAAGVENFNIPATFYTIVTKLSAWYARQSRADHGSGKDDDLLEPMKYMKSADGSVEVETGSTDNSNEAANHSEEPPETSNASLRRTPATSVEGGLLYTFNAEAGLPHQNQQSLQEPFVSDVSQSVPWSSADFQQWNFGDPQGFSAFDPVFTMTNFESSALLAFATDESNRTDTYYMPT
ncbi:hypothetical protein NA57DRAFT_79221 [Rhizodiscina lignyota]|uniref:Zn(2)-C6 fungal-type domain-containing protein n=1 Tax=Rhizodiscina lignyota TaxID=1504668 RepID=A0A9P4I9S5_9PEZI|nr:hypothetical protein NA57DRAFT_79221 [Rhizodiscina lignyota]